MPGHNFSCALYGLKAGERMRRAGWNGKGMWIALVTPEIGEKIMSRRRPPLGWPPREQHVMEATHETLRVLPYFAMRTADGGWVPWLASQTDILAEDWETAQ